MSAGRWPGRGRVRCGGCGGGKPFAALSWLPLALALSGCAGTPWGERLSGSFPPPREPLLPPAAGPQAPAAPLPTPAVGAAPLRSIGSSPAAFPNTPDPKSPPGPPGPNPPPGPPRLKPPAGPPDPKSPAAPSGPKPSATKAPPGPSSPPTSQPVPYRVILRLPRADPSAPAEAVTQALRVAGIPFEVETIERVPAGATAPSVRPAPPPR